MATEIERLFGYVDAADNTTSIKQVGGELYAMSCWTEDFCRLVINAVEASGEFSEVDGDPVPGQEVSLSVLSQRLFDKIQIDFGSRIWPQLQSQWPLIEYCGIQDIFVIKYQLGQQEELRLHHDIAQVSASIKLNRDYEGADLEFPRQGFTNRTIEVGHLLAWPSLVTHPHSSAPITSGVKYSATVWFDLPLIS